MAGILEIGISGLKLHQAALTSTGHNIANADTEGYSRQEVVISSNSPQFKSGSWVGSGAALTDIRRVFDEFLVSQLRKDTTSYKSLDTLATNAEQIDSLLADPGTGIQPGIERMFGAMQAANDDPSSLPARQVVISESQGLVDRFHTIADRLNDQNSIVNGQMEILAGQITTMGEAIAELNSQIQFATSSAQGKSPNDLLDKRDLILKDLSEMVSINVVEQDNNVINVFIGNGQPLVVGNDFNRVEAVNGQNDASRFDLAFVQDNKTQYITSEINGGELGGLLEFRRQVLDPAINQLGRAAIAVSMEFNKQHALGIDLDGMAGGLFFEDINNPTTARLRVTGSATNAKPQDGVIGVYITDPGELQDTDYKIKFIGPNENVFRVTRTSDNSEVLISAVNYDFPQKINIDGFDLTFEAGSFKTGDEFYLTPTRGGAKDIELDIERPQEVALASPIMTDRKVGNIGSGVISSGIVYDATTDAFSVPGELSPPIIIKFTSPTTYDVLDNSDPSHPIPLFPPIMNQSYVPGIVNHLLPKDEGKVSVSSLGGYLPAEPYYQDKLLTPVTPGNGFFPARITISEPDPVTGLQKDRPTLYIPANTSAKETARILSKYPGVEATARTTVQLTNFTKEEDAPLLNTNLFLNGIELTDTLGPNQLKYEKTYPQTVPNPLNADFIADRINANFDFQAQGITAISDGSKVTIVALNGDDLSFELSGDPGAGFSVSNGDDVQVNATGVRPLRPISQYEGYDFTEGGPFTYEFDVPGQGTFSFELDGTFATGDDVIAEIKKQIAATPYQFNGDLDVSISANGNISFQPRLAMNGMSVNGSQKLTMGGQIKVIMDDGLEMRTEPPGSNLFEANPEHKPVYLGYDLTMEGIPAEGDEFTADFNTDAVSDNRNGVLLGEIQNKDIIEGKMTLSEGYGKLVENIGSVTSRAQINAESAKVLLQNSEDAVSSVSGVNLDEEASKLIQFELGYNASAKVISIAKDLFDTLINTFR
ncbi:MAG: flagellar hook-associated protein FlgK [Oceanospirillaceae bacterium]|nr:flagellar hook-associated protein FlgK [Oceanospirillaceae bacterium]MCP5350114.1 flagellar hook-associated protein FlgK [Oceanospirillaceae bacterium]